MWSTAADSLPAKAVLGAECLISNTDESRYH